MLGSVPCGRSLPRYQGSRDVGLCMWPDGSTHAWDVLILEAGASQAYNMDTRSRSCIYVRISSIYVSVESSDFRCVGFASLSSTQGVRPGMLLSNPLAREHWSSRIIDEAAVANTDF